jgi:putative transposase
MPRRLRIHVPGGFYHVTLRGNHRQPVLRCDADRGLLNLIVARAMERYDARLHAYCWMSNHLHFLIQVGQQPLAQPMRQIAGEFARVMQSRMESNGHFFERRYHATLVEATDYLFTALHYIHRNPLEAGVVDVVDQYPWSSHHAYAGRRKEAWLTTAFILGKFAPDAREASRAYEDFIKVDRSDMESPFPAGAFVFGSDEFMDRIRGAKPRAQANQGLQSLIDEACTRFTVEREKLSSPIRDRYLTKVRAWIAHQAGVRGIAGRSEVARALGRSEGTLRSAVLRYPKEIE